MEAPFRINFSASERASLGIEWELEVIDGVTGELKSAAGEVLAEMGDGREDGHPKAKHELLQSTIEILTSVCANVAEARADLAATIAEIEDHTRPRGLSLMCSGTHPYSDWSAQDISPAPRYAQLVENMQWLARRMQIFGVHVHVGVRSPEKAIPMVNALTFYIPHFLALSASSPYWMGKDTGLASSRTKVFEGLPTAGLPYQLSGWDDFERFMHTLISAHTIDSIREVWWDIRPHPNFGTVELRVCDGLPTMSEVITVAAIYQSLVERLDARLDAGEELKRPREWIIRENKWRAARHGLDADIIVDDKGATMPVREAIAELVDDLAPIAERLECGEELRGALKILDRGPSYIRQRQVFGQRGELKDVVDSLVEELRSDTLTPVPAGAPA
ncbi:MAG: glutamate---cysteine ligase / carboxylate-amine ligase [Chloroflexota bacterium]|jgi:carboxylate-amine ligase|nr:glutamate---cysteine ligase / carboxylate-amine ligase [Chloroflexota bacterium]